MKTVAKISIVLACLAILLAAGYVLSSRLSLSGNITVIPASEDMATYEVLKERISTGVSDSNMRIRKAEDIYFVTLSVEMKSFSPFKTEWINLIVENEDGTIMEIGSSNTDAFTTSENFLSIIEQNTWLREINAFGKLEDGDSLYITFFSSSDAPNLKAYVEYYIFGRYHRQEVALKI